MEPGQMHAAYLDSHLSLNYGLVPKPIPRKGQVLIKVEAAPINPSDLHLIEGKYAEFVDFQYPFVPGWEGSGTVIESGGGFMGWYLRGKRVAFSKCQEDQEEGSLIKIGGAYGQYCVTDARQCVPLPDSVSFEQGSSFFVNPMTAIGMVEIVSKARSRAVVITAAASQLGKMMIRLFVRKRITVIATVRSESQEKDLRDTFGLEHIFNTSDDEFLPELKKTCKEARVKYMLECIGGSICGKLMSNLPKGCNVLLYGNLSREAVSDIDCFSFMASEITLKCFKLDVWIASKNIFKLLGIVKKVKRLIKDNLSSKISRQYHLKDINEAVQYYEENMSKGKVLLKPWDFEQDY
ncbi:unnamed protein product [Moneuplotes crassus]|uniref:Enoyl reductase (ER) domain-containing protein n=1 Tax=Euplotes crassus TaxID=5936 RepID=A0AAD2CW94_EUPCR|nr:unnamed protein product [Moneuplotes crassus]